MNRVFVVGLVGLSMLVAGHAFAGDKKADKKGTTTAAAPAMPACGAMMKSLAPLPAKFAELMTAVADGQAAHAAMLTGKDAASVAEAATMKKVSQDHRDMAAAAKKASTDLDAAGSLTPVANEAKPDAKGLEHMQKTAALEKEVAAMMVKHAEDTEKMIAQLKATASAK